MTEIRRYYETTAYMLTSVTRERAHIFSRGRAAALLETMFFYYHHVMRFSLYAYVIMPDHFHLICQPSSRYNVSEIMDAIKGDFARQFNILRRKIGEKLWQNRFYDSGIRSEEELIRRIEYVHNNPVRRGFVMDASDWIYSSIKWYESNTPKSNIIDLFQ